MGFEMKSRSDKPKTSKAADVKGYEKRFMKSIFMESFTPEFKAFIQKANQYKNSKEIYGNLFESARNSKINERNQRIKGAYGAGDLTVLRAQASLVMAGYDLGNYGANGVDGELGSRTIKAIAEFKKTVGLGCNDKLDGETIYALDYITEKGFTKSEIELIGKEARESIKQKKEVGGKDHFNELIGHVLHVEGGFVNHPNDIGGATNRGITFNTFKIGAKEHLGIEPTLENLKKVTVEQAKTLYRKMYWEPIGGSQIDNKQVAHIMFDMAVNSGVKTTVRCMQKILNQNGYLLNVDGVMGSKTLNAINTTNDEKLFDDFKKMRINYYKAIIAKDPTQKVFEKGWMNRINSFIYKN